MELVDGEDLAARLTRGPLPVDEALAVCRPIAAALEAAHSKGVVHRDLKPANVVLTPDGQAKVLDFGLAKSAEPGAASTSGSPSLSPTVTSAGTVAGVLLGTAAYMSPEQARGKPVDRRADLWALGCVIYECLTGVQLFRGETISDSLAAVLRKEPDWSRLPPDTPLLLRLLLQRCLTRDPSRRLQDAGDARVEIEQVIEDPEAEVLGLSATAIGESTGRRVPPGLAALAALVLAAAAAVTAWTLKPLPTPEPLHVAVPIPERFEFVSAFNLSPDGRTLAMVAQEKPTGDEPTRPAVYTRTWADPEFRKLAGSEGAKPFGSRPLFSPSGDRLLVAVSDELRPIARMRSIPLDGGPASTAYEATQRGLLGSRCAFLTDDELLVVSRDQRGIYRVSQSGEEPELVLHLDDDAETMFFQGIEVPSAAGRFAVVVAPTATELTSSALYRIDLVTKEISVMLDNARGVKFLSTGQIVFSRDDALWIAPFDPERAEVTGPARVWLSRFSSIAIDRNGDRVVYRTVDETRDGQAIVVVDAAGEVLETLKETTGRYPGMVALSPDGRRLAYGDRETSQNQWRVWVLDLSSGLTRPITPEGAHAVRPRWTPDGRLSYTRQEGTERLTLMVMDSAPGATSEPLLSGLGERRVGVDSFSPDGEHVIIHDAAPATGEPGLYLYDVGDGASGRPFFASSMGEGNPMFRPDGKWVAYATNGSGRWEVYLRPFVAEQPESAPIHAVTKHGGLNLSWSPDGGTLYYRGLDEDFSTLFAVAIETEPELKISEPRTVFTNMEGVWQVIAMPDGRFIRLQSKASVGAARPDLRLILNSGLGRAAEERR